MAPATAPKKSSSSANRLKVSAVAPKPSRSAKENTPSQAQPRSASATKVATKSSTQTAEPTNRPQPLQKSKIRTDSSHGEDDDELATLRAIVAAQQGVVYLFVYWHYLTHFFQWRSTG
jgi:hypothetical protein